MEERKVYPDVPGYVAESDTSFEASLDIRPSASNMRMEVLAYIKMRGEHGATCDEVEDALRMRHQTASARIRELSLGMSIKDTGKRRLTRSGSMARIYTLAPPQAEMAL